RRDLTEAGSGGEVRQVRLECTQRGDRRGLEWRRVEHDEVSHRVAALRDEGTELVSRLQLPCTDHPGDAGLVRQDGAELLEGLAVLSHSVALDDDLRGRDDAGGE